MLIEHFVGDVSSGYSDRFRRKQFGLGELVEEMIEGTGLARLRVQPQQNEAVRLGEKRSIETSADGNFLPSNAQFPFLPLRRSTHRVTGNRRDKCDRHRGCEVEQWGDIFGHSKL